MGVIKKVLYRDQCLSAPRHRNLFLDMEENIHIHYRDLRIELSRGEFEDICDAFNQQSKELRAIIDKTHYQDGKLANANQENVRIWTESQLKERVKYHPNRFSLEACSDGFHFHYRNYKFLIDEPDFRQIVKLFKNLDVDSPYAQTYSEVLELLEANEVDFMLDAGNVPNEVLAVASAPYHMPKIREVLTLLGFTQETQKEYFCFQGEKLKVLVRSDKEKTVNDYRRLRGFSQTKRLVEFISQQGTGIETSLLNQIKCQVLDLYYSLKASKEVHIEIDIQSWLWAETTQQIIFPYSTQAANGPDAAKILYKSWQGFLSRLGLSFIKPTKIQFTAEAQAVLKKQVADTLRNEIGTKAAVEKIYLMGSSLRGDMGYYQAPFVHGPNAKLGSDVDILIEIHSARETDIPPSWKLINPNSSRGSAVYHITQIPLAQVDKKWSELYPHIDFIHHLIDAYVYFPSQGHGETKEAFLRQFGAKLFYDRQRDGLIPSTGEEQKIADLMTQRYNLSDVIVEPMKVSTENLLYKVFAAEQDAILKLFKVAGNYKSKRIVEHTAYEASLIPELIKRGIVTAAVFPANESSDTTIEGFSALLFERIIGEVQTRPEYDLATICPALAQMHQVQIDAPIALNTSFSFDDVCELWLPYFAIYQKDPNLHPELLELFKRLEPFANHFLDLKLRKKLYLTSPLIHCHGDVTPKNVIINQHGQACFFDFNNCYYGPRMMDLLDGSFEFSLAEKYIHLADFARFDQFFSHYTQVSPLTLAETETLPLWSTLLGIIKFIKEIRVLLETPTENLRHKRAQKLGEFLLSRYDKLPELK